MLTVHSPRYTQVKRMVAPVEPTYLVLIRTADGKEFISNPMDADKANAAIDRIAARLTIGSVILWADSTKLVWNIASV